MRATGRKVFYFKCRQCKNPFESTRPRRMFCSVRCRASHPTFKKFLMENLALPKSRNGPHRSGEELPCLQCQKPVYSKPSRPKKFCGRICYRLWFAARFDRNIGAIDSVDQLSGYDEYLSKPKLKCLHEDCKWSGHSLSHHMNTQHGVTAEQLKERAGFNKGTGLISATLVKILEDRPAQERTPPTALAVAARVGVAVPARREALEHHTKAMALRGRLKKASTQGELDL